MEINAVGKTSEDDEMKPQLCLSNAAGVHETPGAATPPPPYAETVDGPKLSPDVHSTSSSVRPELASPEPNCAICLGKMENKSFTDSCFHQFCFTCLLEWSKVKAECPLCKQSFKSIVHNVRSIEDYDQYHLQTDEYGSWDNPETGRRFRYRSTLTAERRRELAFGRLLLGRRSIVTSPQRPQSSVPTRPLPYSTSEFRRYIYENSLWARASCRASRYREAAPNFYSLNPAVTHRLVPWLNRELNALGYGHQVAFLMELIMSLIHRFHIRSPEFREHIRPYFLGNVDHFVHEFFHFARSPHDMTEYDRQVTYSPAAMDSSFDNDVVVVYSSEGARHNREVLGHTSNILARTRDFLRLVTLSPSPRSDWDYRQRSASPDGDIPNWSSRTTRLHSTPSPVPGPSGLGASVPETSVKQEVTQEVTLDDDDDDCVIVGFRKPPGERTPLAVIVLSDDEQPSTSRAREPDGSQERESRSRSRSSSDTGRKSADKSRSVSQSSSSCKSRHTSKPHNKSHRHKRRHGKHKHHSHRRHRSPTRHHHHRDRESSSSEWREGHSDVEKERKPHCHRLRIVSDDQDD